MYSAFQGWAEYKCGGQCWCLHHQTMYLQDSATELELRVLSGAEERGAKSGLVWNMEHGQCGHHGWRLGEELHQQIFAALTIGHRTMVGSGAGQVA